MRSGRPIQMKPLAHASAPFHTFPHACGGCPSLVRGFRDEPQNWKRAEGIRDFRTDLGGYQTTWTFAQEPESKTRNKVLKTPV